jgi:lipopolysaccharide/colanic/teichoic acid biosynthesis glycosyltransferase
MQQLLDLRFSGIPIEEAPAAFESVFGRVSIQDLRPSQLIFSQEMGPRHWMVLLQRLYSVALGVIGTVVTLPIMAAVALVVKFLPRTHPASANPRRPARQTLCLV